MKQLSISTKIYLALVNVSGIFILIANLGGIKRSNLIVLVILALLGGIFHVLKVEGPTTRSHFTISFIVFGFTIAFFKGPEILIVILAANIFQWILTPPPAWYIQPYNIGSFLITAQAADAIYKLINPLGDLTSLTTILAIIASAACFTIINHLLLGFILLLARGESFKQSGVFDITPVLIDLTMLSLGASLAIVWAFNPYALLLFIIPLYPFYKALTIPALERKTETDQKTGLFNHGYFITQLKNELQRANRYDRPLSIIMADLDYLRNINNTFGHLAGDEVLKGIAGILQETVREYDVVARFGGEEFSILMPEATLEQASQRAELIRKAIEAHSFQVPTSLNPIKVTMSLGVSTREDFEQSGEEIIHNADIALYKSKIQGRNQVFTFIQAQDETTNSPEGQEYTAESPREGAKQKDEYSYSSTAYATSPQVTSKITENSRSKTQEGHIVNSSHPNIHHTSSYKVYLYITAVASVALFAAIFEYKFNSPAIPQTPLEWTGLAILILLTILAEGFSINLYVGNTSISTTAAPLVAGFILFGPLGTLVCSAAYAITTAIKFRSPFNRLVFNFSNHVISGMLINAMIINSGAFLQDWNVGTQLLYTLAASIITYFVTTSLISIGMGIDLKQHPFEIWQDQYRWMAVYYIGIGFVSYSFIFGYQRADLLGVIFIAVPLILVRFSQAQYVGHTREIVTTLRKKNQDLEKSANEIQELSEGLLTTLSEIIDLRDPHVLGHSKQVSEYATQIAKELNISQKQVELIRKAGLLHDLGKLGIPMELLTKPASLNSAEYEVVKKHAALGGDLVKNTPSLRPLAQIIRQHHERHDGNGYPDKVDGNQISIEARIVAVADALEAMSSDRPYRRALKPEKIKEELVKNSGTQFDPLVVNAAVKVLDKIHEAETSSATHAEGQANTKAKLITKTQTP
jgi:diguanylate cyclase (GGDEF)-like protein/putative nucleotidyltransferase with HDIG domain